MRFLQAVASRTLRHRVPRRRVFPGRRPSVQPLESRVVLSASSGTLWTDPSRLTLSFVPDGTKVAGHESSLFSTLNQLDAEARWKDVVFRAFQSWSANANVNVGLVSDSGDPLGVTGSTQGDARFGDIRIAAAPLSGDVAAISIPSNGALSGTWVGDIILNQNANFTDLDQFYGVMLHEAGHVLGLEHSHDPASPMFPVASNGVELNPTDDDLNQLRGINGRRTPDANELQKANDTVKRATRIRYSSVSSGYSGQTPLLSYGDITEPDDVDYYFLPTLSGYDGPVTFSLRSSGFSMLGSKLTVLDESGQTIATQSSQGIPGTDLFLTIQHSDRDDMYVVRVEADSNSRYSTGSYALVTTFDGRNEVSEPRTAEVVRLRYDFLREEDLRPTFQGDTEVAFNDDLHTNDSLLTATTLKPDPGLPEFQHYVTTAGIADPADVDYYKVKAPSFPGDTAGVMTVTVQSTRIGALLPDLIALDRKGRELETNVIYSGRGELRLQVEGIEGSKGYFIAVRSRDPDSRYATGNYHLDVSFGTTPVEREPLVAGELASGIEPTLFAINIYETQLFQFSLSSKLIAPQPSEVAVQLSVLTGRGEQVQRIVGLAGDARTGQGVVLTPGVYFARVQAIGRASTPIPMIEFLVSGTRLSDPVGPVPSDPTSEPPPPQSDPTLDPFAIDTILYSQELESVLFPVTPYDDPWSIVPPDPIFDPSADPFYQPILEPDYDPLLDPTIDPLYSWYWS